jgi:mitochondrial distribution and morphology protein 10
MPDLLDLLDFNTPMGFQLHTASFAAEQFTAAATLSALPILDGSVAYTYTSKPLKGVQGTVSSALIDLLQGFREIKPPRAPDEARHWEIWQAGRRVDYRGHNFVSSSTNCKTLCTMEGCISRHPS